MKMKLFTVGCSSLLSLMVLLCLGRPSVQLRFKPRQMIDVIHFNGTSCNQIIEVDGLATTRRLKVEANDCLGCAENVTCQLFSQNKCTVTYTSKTQFVGKAYKFCGEIHALYFNCDLKVEMGYSHDGKTNSKRFSCWQPPFRKYCAPTSSDLQVSLETNFCERNRYFTLELMPVFSNTYELQYSVAECDRMLTTITKTEGSIMSHVPLDISQNVCGVYLTPYFYIDHNWVVDFCIEFVYYQFLQGGPKLKITILKHSNDDEMIFDNTKPGPKVQICDSWFTFSKIMVTVVPGENPNIKRHSFLFHYSFKEKELRKDDEDEDEDSETTTYSMIFATFSFFFSIVGCICICLKKKKKRNMQENREAADGGGSNDEPNPLIENPPSYMELNIRTAGSRTISPSPTNEIRPTMPTAPVLDPTGPPSYDSLFPDGK